MRLQHLYTIFHSLILLLFFTSLCSAILIDNCEIYQSISEFNIPPSCLKCTKHHILDSTATLCQQKPLEFSNCIQLSIFGDCQRCDCGFSLSNNQNTCIPSPINLFGCEVIDKDSICIRPKYDFLFLTTNRVISSIEYARGSHCEILDTKSQCEQCHAGYKMISPSKICVSHSPKLVNEHYSYFSQDGELHSRNIEFFPSRYGVFPKINHCEKHNSKEINSIYESFCEICDLGKILNNSKTACIKPPIQQCAKVSDSNQNVCEECLDNEHFYLTKEQRNNQLTCVPRESNLLNPTERCLQWFSDSPRCKTCQKGLLPTFEGCTIEINLNNTISLIFHFNEKPPLETPLDIAVPLYAKRNFCELFQDDTNTTCLSCAKGMILDILGQCQQQTDFNCYLVNNLGECLKCISLMHYDPQVKKCVLISNFHQCASSLGTSEDCQLFLHNDLQVPFNNTISILFCQQLAENSQNYCVICSNLYYLNKNDTSCEQITNYEDCYFSEGIIDKCELCKNGFVFDEDEQACVSQIFFDFEAGACTNQLFYRKNEIDNLCVRYSFLNYQMCFQFHYLKNECLECYSGYYLESGQCQQASLCSSTNGIDDFCYLAQSFFDYTNEFGKVVKINDSNCYTNQIEYRCDYCIIKGDNTGAYLNDNSTCVDKGTIEKKYQYECYQFRQQNSKIVCDLCSSLHYPDSSGICQKLSDKNCEASGGRQDQCRLCHKLFYINENGICTSQPSQLKPFCKQMEGNLCKVCQNGYCLNYFFCQAISNPNCQLSDGILDRCKICSYEGVIFTSLEDFQQVRCYEKECEKIEGKTTCKPCKLGFSLIQRWDFQKQQQVYLCTRQKILHCEVEDRLQESCLKCSPGFFRSFKDYDYSSVVICRQITLENCLDQTIDGRDCKQCQEGYELLQSGLCFKQKSCRKFKDGICVECKEEFYNQDGICKKIENCQRQYEKKCNQCLPGYWRKVRNGKQLESIRGEQEQSTNQKMQSQKYELRTTRLIIEKEIDSIDWCFRIPHCGLSDGISFTCLQCNVGYDLRKGICIREKVNQEHNKNCRVFSMDYDLNQIICVQCKILFFLEEKSCKQLENSPPCIMSDGIHRNCLSCSVQGWILNVPRGECEVIPNCLLSNGITLCIQCEEDYVVSDSGMVCERLKINIENCEVYSYERIEHLPAIISNSITNIKKKILDSRLSTFETYLISKKQLNDLDNNKEVQDHPGCVSCRSLQFQSNFQDCVLTDQNKLISQNCQRFDEQLQICTSCKNGFLPQLEKDYQISFQCAKLHWYFQLINLGCAIFNQNMECWKCLDSFYLDKNGFCQPRIVLMQKCKAFNTKKDECIEYKSGYKLVMITRKKTRNQVICLGLEPHEQVENCAEYLPNTNKCIKCQKFLEEMNVQEYVLNEELNVCEDVLGLMCREIDYSTKTCIQKYIQNCEEYERDSVPSTDGSGCAKCYKRYFLEQEGKECLLHDMVDNCLVYSRTQRSVCEVCEQQYYLDKVSMKCRINSHNNCLISMKEQDYCQICENSFAVDNLSGDCIKSTITNCKSSTNSKDNEEICLKCQNNFKLVDSGKVCLLELFDFNCKKFDQLSKCSECNAGYLLNHNGLCIATASSIGQISSCLEYSIESTEESRLRCKKCLGNFFLDESHECQPLNPDSDLQEEANTAKEESIGQKKISQSEIEQRQPIISTILKTVVRLVTLLAVVIGLIVCLRRYYLKRIEKKRNIQDSSQFENEEEPQQQEQQQEQEQQFSTQIQMDSTISIKGSLEYTLNQ